MKRDPRVDAYIVQAPPFAQPLLKEVRERIHQAVPDAVETIKWRVPFYELNGKIVANMAAFKAHTKFGIWLQMQPKMVDVRTAAELPPAAAFAKELKAAAELARNAGAAPRKSRMKPAADKAPAGKPSVKPKALAKKIVAKKTVAKKTVAKTAARASSKRARK
jgi:hypothetical protein